MRKVPDSYYRQRGCWNCYHCFRITGVDDPTRYFCLEDEEKFKKSNNPRDYDKDDIGEWWANWAAQDIYQRIEWNKEREVKREGLCAFWEEIIDTMRLSQFGDLGL